MLTAVLLLGLGVYHVDGKWAKNDDGVSPKDYYCNIIVNKTRGNILQKCIGTGLAFQFGRTDPVRTMDASPRWDKGAAKEEFFINITGIQDGAFTGLSGIRFLELNDNAITVIQSGLFTDLTILQKLHLYNNKISSIPNDLFKHNPQLQELKLSHNKITSIPDKLFDHTPVLKYFYIDHNEIKSVPTTLFQYTTALDRLYLGDNEITSVPKNLFKYTTKLYILVLSGNLLTDVPEFGSQLVKLRTLNLQFNKIVDISDDGKDPFRELLALRTLVLAGNLLESVPKFSSKLSSLKLYNNSITTIPPGLYANMYIVDLNKNQLTIIRKGDFSGSTKISFLNLYENKITMIQRGAFEDMERLTTLNVGYNEIDFIEGPGEPFEDVCAAVKNTPPGFEPTQRVTLMPNPLMCRYFNKSQTELCPKEGFTAECDACQRNYVVNQTHLKEYGQTRCQPKTFELRSETDEEKKRKEDFLTENFFKKFEDGQAHVYQGLVFPTGPDIKNIPKDDLFWGYSDQGFAYDGIRFEFKFKRVEEEDPVEDPVDITCNQTVFRDLEERIFRDLGERDCVGTPRYNNDWFYKDREDLEGYLSREAYLNFSVTTDDSVFEFDSCGSRFPTSLAVLNVDVPNIDKNYLHNIPMNTPFLQHNKKIPGYYAPSELGCDFSQSSKFTTKVPLKIGYYSLMVQGTLSSVDLDPSEFQVTMKCINGSAAKHRKPIDPGGIHVNPKTGEISGTPLEVGDYAVDFIATDTAGSIAVLAEWKFSVIPVLILDDTNSFEINLVPNDEHENGGNGLLENMTIGNTYRYNVTGDINETVDNAIGNLSYRLNINSANAGAKEDILINTETGTLQASPLSEYTAFVQILAVDDGGVERTAVLQNWTFTARPADTANVTNGPNGKGCDNGEMEDVTLYNNFFDCTCPGFSGDNCQLLNQLQVVFDQSQSYTDSTINGTDYTGRKRTQWAIHQDYSLAPVHLSSANTSDGEDITVDSIQFILVNGPPGFFIDGKTGELLGKPKESLDQTVSTLYATYENTTKAKLWELVFECLPADTANNANGPNGEGCYDSGTKKMDDGVEFDSNFRCDCVEGFVGENCEQKTNVIETNLIVRYEPTETDNRAQWAFNTSYDIPGFKVTSAQTLNVMTNELTNVSKDDLPLITFVLSPSPPGFFINGETGALLGKPKTAHTSNATLSATYKGAKDYIMRNMTFEFLDADIADCSNGPNNLCCNEGGTKKIVDEVEFDNRFTCNCSSDYDHSADANCGVKSPEFSTGGNTANSWTLIGPLIGVIAIVFVLMITWRVQVHRIKSRPLDLNAIQLQLLAELGLGATAAMKDTQVGVTVTLTPLTDQSPEPHGGVLDKLKRSVLKVLATKLKISPFGAAVQPGPAPLRAVVVVFHKPDDYREDVFSQKVTDFHNKLQTSPMSYGGMKLTSAMVAMPTRTPREIHRNALARIETIASGNYGEVFKGELSEGRLGRTMKTIVAVKVCRGKTSETAQDNLMKEAALMALFDHRNVLSLIGVITTPRDMAAMLVIAYCDHESLLEYVREHGTETAIATKLTFCTEVAQGLEYISSLRVIHRDVAARNILLDALLVCKVADFGLATALSDSKEYARLDKSDDKDKNGDNNEMPLRWAAPEVITNSRFSTQSDIWAFGVMIWEVFSNGKIPYEGFTLPEAAAKIREGVVLPKLPANMCPDEIHQTLMAVCFRIDVATRPTFRDIYDQAIYLGASEDDVAVVEQRVKMSRRRSMIDSSTRLTESEVLERQGPSVDHLNTDFITKTLKAVSEQMPNMLGIKDPADAKIYHMVQAYGKPAGLTATCPRDGKPGAAYVDTLSGAEQVGIANALLSYSWGYKVQDVVDALVDWTMQKKQDQKNTYIWICSLCLNQHRIIAALTPDQLAKEFGERVTGIGLVLPMLEDWQNPGYVKRAWCLFELYTAIRMNLIEVDIILTKAQRQACANTVNSEGFQAVDKALSKVKAEEATATEIADLKAIQALIKRYHGGYAALNEAVKVQMRAWFQKITGIRFARKITKRAKGSAPELEEDISNSFELKDLSSNSSSAQNNSSSTQNEPTSFGFAEDDNDKYGFDEADTLF